MTGGDLVGWPPRRHQLLEQMGEKVVVCARGAYRILPLAEYSLLGGVKPNDRPPTIGTRREIFAKYELTTRH